MKLTVACVDFAPPELQEQVPFAFKVLRMIPGPDRPDYWLGELDQPLRWVSNNQERRVEHLVVCARLHGTQIGPLVQRIAIGIAYVTDRTQLDDASVSFDKCEYVAIGIASDAGGGMARPLQEG